jgi:hypothetical protein
MYFRVRYCLAQIIDICRQGAKTCLQGLGCLELAIEIGQVSVYTVVYTFLQ